MLSSPFTRRIITVFTTLLFIASIGIGLLIVRGNTITTDGISETGTIRLDISPSNGFEVYLNEQKQSVTSNNTVSSIQPGEYNLKITSPKYTVWQQQVVVYAGLVTDVSVKLFPESLKLEQITKTSIQQVAFASNNRQVFYLVQDSQLGGNIGLWEQNLVKNNIPLVDEQPVKLSNLTLPLSIGIAKNALSLIPAPNGEKLLVESASDFYVLDGNRYNEPTTANKLNFSFPVDKIDWLKDSSNLLIQSSSLLLDYELQTGKTTLITYQLAQAPIYSQQISSVVYYLNGKLYRYSNGQSTEIKLENISLPKNVTNIYSSQSNDSSLIIKTDGKLYYLYLPQSYIGELGSYQLVSFAPNGGSLIVKSAQGEFKSIEITISLTRSLVESNTRTTTLGSDFDPSSLVWDPASNFFVFRRLKEATKIYSADNTGNNIQAILSSENLLPGYDYKILSDGNSLVILLRDDQAAQTKRNNLYSLKFSI